MRRMITDKLTKNIKEVVAAYQAGEIGTEVVANPTLAGDESKLTGLQVGDTKYAVPQGGGATYTAGTGIDITSSTISVDNTVALKSDIIDVVANTSSTPSATLTNLQVGSVIYAVPQGGGGSATLYRHYVTIDGVDESYNATCNLIVDIISTSNTPITSLDAIKTILNSGTSTGAVRRGILASGAVKDGANVRNIIALRINADTLVGHYVDGSNQYVLYSNVNIPTTVDVLDTIFTL